MKINLLVASEIISEKILFPMKKKIQNFNTRYLNIIINID